MVEIPRSLRSVFTATVDERGDGYVLEIPPGEVENDAVRAGETYRVALLEAQRGGAPDRKGSEPQQPPVTEGERRQVTVETVGDQGDGIAKVERGFVVIVPGGRPGDELTVEIEDVRRNVAFARVVQGEP